MERIQVSEVTIRFFGEYDPSSWGVGVAVGIGPEYGIAIAVGPFVLGFEVSR